MTPHKCHLGFVVCVSPEGWSGTSYMVPLLKIIGLQRDLLKFPRPTPPTSPSLTTLLLGRVLLRAPTPSSPRPS